MGQLFQQTYPYKSRQFCCGKTGRLRHLIFQHLQIITRIHFALWSSAWLALWQDIGHFLWRSENAGKQTPVGKVRPSLWTGKHPTCNGNKKLAIKSKEKAKSQQNDLLYGICQRSGVFRQLLWSRVSLSMPSADLLLCLKKTTKGGGSLYLNDTGKIPVLWAPHPHLLMWSKVLLWRHLIKKPWLIYMETFDLNYTPNRTKLGASGNVKCLFPVTARTGPALDGTCSSDEKYFTCNVLLRPTFPLIIHSQPNQYLYFHNYFRLWKIMSLFFFLQLERGRRPPT